MNGLVKNTCGTRRVVFAVGLLLFFSGFGVLANNADGNPGYGEWFRIIVGLLIALVAAYAKGVESRVTKAETGLDASSTRITDLRELLAGQHYDKGEIDRRFDHIEQLIAQSRAESLNGISAVHRRLDYLRVPPATSNIEGR